MASRFWVGGTGTWNTSTTTNWSASTGGAGGASAPISSDDVFFDGNSGGGTVTMAIGPVCANLVCTGFTGTFAGNIGLSVSGTVITFASGMTLAMSADITIVNTAPAALTTAGVATSNFHGLFFNGSAAVTLQDDCILGATPSFQVNANTVNTNGKTVTCGGFAASSGATFNLGASTINCSSVSGPGTINTGTSSIICSTSSVANTVTYYNLTFTNSGNNSVTSLTVSNILNITTGGGTLTIDGTITGAATFTGTAALGNIITFDAAFSCAGLTIAGNSPLNRLLVNSSVAGTARTLTCTSVNLTNVDFQDITLSNSGSGSTSSIGNCGRNTGISFPSGTNYYWINPGASPNFFSNNWATSSGGTPGTGFPAPGVDTAIFDANSFSVGSITVSLAGYAGSRIPSIDFTGVTNSPTLTTANTLQLYGASYKFNSGMTIAGTNATTIPGNGTVAMETGGAQWTAPLNMNGIGGTLTFSGDFTSSSTLTHNLGTINRGTHNIQFTTFTSSSGSTRIHIENSATATFNGLTFNIANPTGLTWTKGTGITKFTNSTASNKTFTGGGLSFGTIYINTTSTGTFNIVGSNSFSSIQADPGRTIKLTAGTTTTVGALPSGSAAGGNITITSITASTHTLSTASPFIACDYLTLSQSTATQTNTFFAGANSTNSGSNTNWVFTALPYLPTVQSFNGIAKNNIASINGISLNNISSFNGNIPRNGLVAWFDAANVTTITSSSGLVSQWNDISGNGYNFTQATGALQPTTGSVTRNGYNVITFDGTRSLENTSAGLLAIPNSSNTIFAVANSSVDNAVERILHIGTVAAQRYSLSFNSATNTAAFNNGNNLLSSPVTKANYNILTAHRDSANQFLSFNNGTEATNALAVSANDSDLAAIGSTRSTTQFLTGNIAEIIIYNRSLSAAEISQVNHYLGSKWAITTS